MASVHRDHGNLLAECRTEPGLRRVILSPRSGESAVERVSISLPGVGHLAPRSAARLIAREVVGEPHEPAAVVVGHGHMPVEPEAVGRLFVHAVDGRADPSRELPRKVSERQRRAPHGLLLGPEQVHAAAPRAVEGVEGVVRVSPHRERDLGKPGPVLGRPRPQRVRPRSAVAGEPLGVGRRHRADHLPQLARELVALVRGLARPEPPEHVLGRRLHEVGSLNLHRKRPLSLSPAALPSCRPRDQRRRGGEPSPAQS